MGRHSTVLVKQVEMVLSPGHEECMACGATEKRDTGVCRRPGSILGRELFDLDKVCPECGMNSFLFCCKQMHKNLKIRVNVGLFRAAT